MAGTVHAQTRPWSSDPAVRMRNALEADMNRHSVAANLQSQRVMQANLQAINSRFQDFYAAIDAHEREQRAAADRAAATPVVPWLDQVLALGTPNEVALWGGLLVQGQGVPKNLERGLTLVRHAAAQGSARAKSLLGTYHFEGLGMPRDAAMAARLWQEAVAGGQHYPAAHNLAAIYRNGGAGVARDPAQARRFAAIGAEGGDAEMASLIGRMLLTGEGGAVDLPGAVKWLQQAAQAGEPVAQTNLAWLSQRGEGVPRDMAAAARLYRSAAQSGVDNAQFWWGRYVLGGVGGVAQDPVEGVNWLRKAAAQGQAEAALELGRLLLGGFGPVAANPEEALKFLRQAAASPAPSVAGAGHTLLGSIHEGGWGGTAKNLVQAVGHYESAAALKHVEGSARLGLLFALGIGVPQNAQRAGALIDSAYASREPWGLAAMAFLHERGISQPKDLQRARTLFEEAVKAGGTQFQGDVERIKKLLNV